MKSIEAAKAFAEEIAKKYSEVVKAVWLVTEGGSNTAIVLLDDTKTEDVMTLELVKGELPLIEKKIEKDNVRATDRGRLVLDELSARLI